MCIAGAKPEEHCFSISGVILGYVLCCFTGTTYAIITFAICIKQKHEYLQNEIEIFQKGKHYDYFFFTLNGTYMLIIWEVMHVHSLPLTIS